MWIVISSIIIDDFVIKLCQIICLFQCYRKYYCKMINRKDTLRDFEKIVHYGFFLAICGDICMCYLAKTLASSCSFLWPFYKASFVNSVTERKCRQNSLWLLLLFPCLFVLGLDWLWGCRRACLILAFFPQHSFISLLPSAFTTLFKMT